MILFYSFCFLLGIIVGSFLNVVILRLNSGKGIGGRSMCFSCSKNLSWYELIPVVSFIALNGKCRSCKSRISFQYPFVEILTGTLFLFFSYHSHVYFPIFIPNILFLISDWFIWSILVVIFVYDLRHKIIPDNLTILFIFGGVFQALVGIVFNLISVEVFIFNYLIAAVLISLFFFLFWAVSGGRWMGLGDAKLGFAIGLYLGLAQGISAVTFAFWLGAVIALGLLLFYNILGKSHLRTTGKEVTMKSEIPFAPFLILGMFLALFFGSDIFHISLLFS